MTIEFIDNTNKFFDDVKALGRRNSATLGFMPEGGFEDHARNKCIIIAHQENELVGYLMYRIVSRYSRISIVHLCVADAYRGKGVSTSLLNALKEKYEKVCRGISLSCRTDFIYASSVWRNFGFVPREKVRSRSFEENYLNRWWYDFNQPDLFTISLTSKVKALLDMNIIVKLREAEGAGSVNPQEDPRGLLADWLIDETELCFAPEAFNEIDRDENLQRAQITRKFLSSFTQLQVDMEEQKKIVKNLETIICGRSENDISDRKQIASCIVSETPYFITYDEGLISKKEEIEKQYPIQIYNPQEFIIQIDKLLHGEEYIPNQLKGVSSDTISKLNPRELSLCIDKFWMQKQNEDKQTFNNTVSDLINKQSGNLYVMKRHKDIIAFYGLLKKQDKVIVGFVRIIDIPFSDSLFFQIVSDILNVCLKESKTQIIIEEQYLKVEWISILQNFGFIPNPQKKHVKYAINRQINRNDIKNIIQEIEIPIQIDENNDSLLVKTEKMLFPLKIVGINIPIYVIPIKPYWAGQLFDECIASEDLFGADPNKLWSFENVYYRHIKPLNEKTPARILWYVSGGDKGVSRSKSIVASSYLTDIITGKPKELYRLYKHYGIYEWEHVYDLCNKDITQEIKILKFSHTEVFNYPVCYEKIKRIFMKNGRPANTFASPVHISESIYFDIYNLGIGGKK